MDEIGVHNPLLLSSQPSRRAFVRKIPLFVTLTKWILKITMWVLFISWVVFIFVFPLGSVQTLFGDWIAATDGTLFGTTGLSAGIWSTHHCLLCSSFHLKLKLKLTLESDAGTLLLLFNGPLLLIALLSIAFLAMSGEEELPYKYVHWVVLKNTLIAAFLYQLLSCLYFNQMWWVYIYIFKFRCSSSIISLECSPNRFFIV